MATITEGLVPKTPRGQRSDGGTGSDGPSMFGTAAVKRCSPRYADRALSE